MSVASIVIPTYQHATVLPAAIESALHQTVPCEVIVVDDGSTDDTPKILAEYGSRVRAIRIDHAGLAPARNAGLELAQSDYVMFLDADDTIAPTKIARQVDAFTPGVDWVLCDVTITHPNEGKVQTASEKYAYVESIADELPDRLRRGNLFPVMAPLLRRSSIPDALRFEQAYVPNEDWHFWRRFSEGARAAYVPEVLATYHRPWNNSQSSHAHERYAPPLRLNLGCGTPGTAAWHPLEGFVNLDESLGWRFEDGLSPYADRSVAGITISHALMYVAASDWPRVLRECARVLMEGGVLRITEDDTAHPKSARHGGWKGRAPAVTLTSPAFVSAQLDRAGLRAMAMTSETSRFLDQSLCQAYRGAEPDVFFMEGLKEPVVVFAPHHDDETLFASFAIAQYRARVVVCLPSHPNYGEQGVRMKETGKAVKYLGGGAVEHWDGSALTAAMRGYEARVRPGRVFAPHPHASHPDHVAVSTAAREVFGARVTYYHTYTERGKVRSGIRVEPEVAWIGQKLKALAAYQSQWAHPRASKFFLDDLAEYREAVA